MHQLDLLDIATVGDLWIGQSLNDPVPELTSQLSSPPSKVVSIGEPSPNRSPGYQTICDVKSQQASPEQTMNSSTLSLPSMKKSPPTRIPKEARLILEENFQSSPYPSTQDVSTIAKLTSLKPTTVKNWFNNSRARRNLGGMYSKLFKGLLLAHVRERNC